MLNNIKLISDYCELYDEQDNNIVYTVYYIGNGVYFCRSHCGKKVAFYKEIVPFKEVGREQRIRINHYMTANHNDDSPISRRDMFVQNELVELLDIISYESKI